MPVSMSRRALLRGDPHQNRPLSAEHSPPWTDESFTEACVRCGDCIKACPEDVLFKGDGGFPQIQFKDEGCTFCEECVRACDEPVFDLTRQAFSWRAQIQDACLAKANIHCQSCQDACESDAIRFSPALGRVPSPRVALEDCTGCGACVAVCPQDAIELVTPTEPSMTVDKDADHA